jgi:predicted DNA-binding transcriptional regulator AlpA
MSSRRGAQHQAISMDVMPCLSNSGRPTTDFRPGAGPNSETGTEERARAERNVLPAGVMPRGLSRVRAAAYVGVSPTTFDRMVRDKLMPQPLRIYGRIVWDLRKLDDAFAALDRDDTADDPWEDKSL